MRLINDHFSPTSAPFSAMVYLEPKLLRFQGLICRIYHFCDLLSCEDIVKNVRNAFLSPVAFLLLQSLESARPLRGHLLAPPEGLCARSYPGSTPGADPKRQGVIPRWFKWKKNLLGKYTRTYKWKDRRVGWNSYLDLQATKYHLLVWICKYQYNNFMA